MTVASRPPTTAAQSSARIGRKAPGVLILDADTVLGRALCAELAAAGTNVFPHIRGDLPDRHFDGVCLLQGERCDGIIGQWDLSGAPIRHVVFGQSAGFTQAADSPDQMDALASVLEERLSVFLLELQAAGRLLARCGGGQIWVLTQEEGMRHCMHVDSCPIDTRARLAAAKSFAKEIYRLGVKVNCASIQLLAEQAPPEVWRASRDLLKAFAMRFEPVTAAAVAKTLAGFLHQEQLPIAGLVIPIGVGFAEQSI